MKKMKFLSFLVAATCLSLRADVKLPSIFSDNMILQRDCKVNVWGWADDGEKVTVNFKGQTVSAIAKNGKFMLSLNPISASAIGEKLTVQGKNKIELNNVIVGDIYLCSGQSNMEWRLQNSDNATEAIARANYPAIRLFYGNTYKSSLTPQNNIPGKTWEVCSPATVGRFSGVAYFFAENLYKELNVPIGLISANWGGTRIEPWISAYGFSTQKSLAAQYAQLVKFIPGTPEYTANQKQIVADMKKWIADSEDAAKNNSYLPEIPQSIREIPQLTTHQKDTVLYNNMLAPIKNFKLKGALWYQGCANLTDGMLYRDKMHALIASWRKEFDIPDMPLYFVQLAPFTYGTEFLLPKFWAVQQTFADEDPNAHMAVINDIGHYRDIHPRNKHDVGHRLALLALKYTYNKDIVADSPFFGSLKKDGKNLIVTFKNATKMKTTDGKAPKYFEIAGEDGIFYPAEAELLDNQAILKNDKVADPFMVRYAWRQNVTTTLVNENNLPAGAFNKSLPIPVRQNLDRLVPEAKNMKVAYAVSVKNVREGNDIAYLVDNSNELSGKKIKKIGYFMFLNNKNGERYVYATVNPFSQDIKKLGIPTVANKAYFQQKVTNLTVKTNAPNLTSGNFADGNVEIWSSDYNAGNSAKIDGASDAAFDFGDGGGNSNRNGFGSFQLHNYALKEVVFALNKFAGPVDVGIGNNSPNQHLDYTFSGNSRNYDYGILLIMVEVE